MILKTTELFWDCECKENYIHYKTEEKCNKCNAIKEEQPNSIIKEVIPVLRKREEELMKQMNICFGSEEIRELCFIISTLQELEGEIGDSI